MKNLYTNQFFLIMQETLEPVAVSEEELSLTLELLKKTASYLYLTKIETDHFSRAEMSKIWLKFFISENKGFPADEQLLLFFDIFVQNLIFINDFIPETTLKEIKRVVFGRLSDACA